MKYVFTTTKYAFVVVASSDVGSLISVNSTNLVSFALPFVNLFALVLIELRQVIVSFLRSFFRLKVAFIQQLLLEHLLQLFLLFLLLQLQFKESYISKPLLKFF